MCFFCEYNFSIPLVHRKILTNIISSSETGLTLSNLGKVEYPAYSLFPGKPLFSSRNSFLIYECLCKLSQSLYHNYLDGLSEQELVQIASSLSDLVDLANSLQSSKDTTSTSHPSAGKSSIPDLSPYLSTFTSILSSSSVSTTATTGSNSQLIGTILQSPPTSQPGDDSAMTVLSNPATVGLPSFSQMDQASNGEKSYLAVIRAHMDELKSLLMAELHDGDNNHDDGDGDVKCSKEWQVQLVNCNCNCNENENENEKTRQKGNQDSSLSSSSSDQSFYRKEYYAIATTMNSLLPSSIHSNNTHTTNKDNQQNNHHHLLLQSQSRHILSIINPATILCRISSKFLHYLVEKKSLASVGMLSAKLLSTNCVDNRGSVWCLFIIAYVRYHRDKNLIDLLLLALCDSEGRNSCID